MIYKNDIEGPLNNNKRSCLPRATPPCLPTATSPSDDDVDVVGDDDDVVQALVE